MGATGGPDELRLCAAPEQAAQHANAIWKQLLANYTPPPIDPAIDEALKDYVAKRKAEGGVPGY